MTPLRHLQYLADDPKWVGAKAAILRQHPHTRPSRTKKSPAPLYHAATKALRKAFWQAYAAFVSAFREAADKWREGDRNARFPVGSWILGVDLRCGELPGANTQGATLEEARENLREAVQLVLEANRVLAEEELEGLEAIREPLKVSA